MTLFAIIIAIAQLLGIISSITALMTTRTSQGAIAWIVALNSFPLIAVPAYWAFGHNKFQGYVTARNTVDAQHQQTIAKIHQQIKPFKVQFRKKQQGVLVGERLAQLPFLDSNAVELLIDGKQTFDSIFAGIAAANNYVLVQFYIIHADNLGIQLKKALIEATQRGVSTYLLYDEVGCHTLPNSYTAELRAAGVTVHEFNSTQKGFFSRFQINFRNHRKIVVVDGKTGWVGGHNVGDEYLGKDKKFGFWRDTHLKITGPAALELQLSVLEDYHWAAGELLELAWEAHPVPNHDAKVLILPSGPADKLETASLMYQQAINSAVERIWIASPYFIPDESVLSALHIAALRGVEVKILIPDKADKKLVYFSTYAFVDDLLQSGIEIYRYHKGFLHEKVFLVDDKLTGIGTANFDNRSFRLNFEVTALVMDADLIKAVEQMFLCDFSNAKAMTTVELKNKPWWFKVLARAAYLTAPIQ